MTDAINGNDLGLEKKRKIKKYSINNKIREQISKILSIMDLDSLDAETRLSAVKSMIQSPSADNVILLEQRVDQEKDVSKFFDILDDFYMSKATKLGRYLIPGADFFVGHF